MNHSNHILNDLVSVARDGKSFYEDTAAKIDNPELRTLFTRLATVKGDIVSSLSSEIRTTGETPADSGTWVGSFNKMYGDVRAMFGDKTYAFVAQLEESEDRLLKGFNEALQDKEITSNARMTLNRLLPEVRSCHEIMRNRKVALKKAA